MAKEVRIPIKEFAANLHEVLERVIHERETIIVETSDDVDIIVHLDMRLRPAEGPDGKKSAHAWDAFIASAGSWSDVDTDRLLADIYARRDAPSRPPVDL